jgi:replicative DNA helicase
MMDKTGEDFLKSLEEELEIEIRKEKEVDEKVKPIQYYVDRLEKDLLKRGEEPEISLKSLPKLNNIIWGFTPGELVVIGARSSVGKSALAIQIATDLLEQGHEVAFMSLEMNIESILERMYCRMMSVNNYFIKTGNYRENQEAQNKFKSFKEVVKHFNAKFTIGIGKTFGELVDYLDRHKPPEVLIIDYVQMIKKGATSSFHDIAEYVNEIKEYAIKKNFVVVLCSQLNRETSKGSKKPQMHELKFSGALEEAADKVILLDWEWKRDDTKLMSDYDIIVEKNRNGMTGDVYVHYEPQYYSFRDKTDVEKYDEYKKDNERKPYKEDLL